MCWMHRIHENSLPRVKGVSAFGCGLSFCGAESCFWLGRRNFQQRKIFNLSGPGESGVCEYGICFRTGNLRQRHGNKRNMPESSRKNCAARQAALDPDILEKTRGEKIFGDTRTAE